MEEVAALLSFFLRCMFTTIATRITTTRTNNTPPTRHDVTMGTKVGLLGEVGVPASKHEIPVATAPV